MKYAKCIFAASFWKYKLVHCSNVEILVTGQLCQAKGASSDVFHQFFKPIHAAAKVKTGSQIKTSSKEGQAIYKPPLRFLHKHKSPAELDNATSFLKNHPKS